MSHGAHSRAPALPGPALGILGVYWFLASEAALFGGLWLGALYLREASSDWTHAAEHLSILTAAAGTVLLFAAAWSLRQAARKAEGNSFSWLFASIVAGLSFLLLKATDFRAHWEHGLRPDTGVFWASYYLLTGLHGLHVAAGVAVCGWLAWRLWLASPAGPTWLRGARLYWYFVDAVWLALLGLFYLP